MSQPGDSRKPPAEAVKPAPLVAPATRAAAGAVGGFAGAVQVGAVDDEVERAF